MITSNNIKSMTIIATCDNGQHLLAKVSEDNKGLISVIVGNTQWYVLKPDMVEQYSLAELVEVGEQ